MKKLTVLLVILFVTLSSATAQHPDGIRGYWVSSDKNAKIEIFKSGTKYYGRIVSCKAMYEADGRTIKKDSKNSDEKLRNRSLLHLVILSGFTYDDGVWNDGELYYPKTGKTYSGIMKLKSGTLEIRGYIGSTLFGKTTVWTRVS